MKTKNNQLTVQYNFDKIVERRGSNSYKWDSMEAKDCLPLWVADMDFEAAPCIREAMQKRLDHGVFGYTVVPDSCFEAAGRWFAQRHGWNSLTREKTLYTIGVVPAISALLQGLGKEGDGVLILSPTYNCFYSSIRNSSMRVVESELVEEGGYFAPDWEDVARKMQSVQFLLLCNPHNPVGRIWSKEELMRLARMAEQAGVMVISDEIHCEFAFPGEHYTPYATVAEGTQFAVCVSASKAFNVAGLQFALIYMPDDAQRERVDKQINKVEICDVNPFGPVAMEAAYSDEGAEWLDQLMAYIYENYCALTDFLGAHLPEVRVTKMEGTYLAWVDCRALLDEETPDSSALVHRIAKEAGVLFNAGLMYGTGGKNYLRINMACPRAQLLKALQKWVDYARK